MSSSYVEDLYSLSFLRYDGLERKAHKKDSLEKGSLFEGETIKPKGLVVFPSN